ncbi:Protein ABHD16A [Nymphon striatum]|nr:Protein ABHD16A [Nymphon striatum]
MKRSRLFSNDNEEFQSHNYIENSIESFSDKIIKSITYAFYIGIYTSPITYFTFFKRGIGRYANREYAQFMATLQAAEKSASKKNQDALRCYDFDFSRWPVDFSFDETKGDSSKPKSFLNSSISLKRTTIFDSIKALPCQILSYVVIHSFGRRMIYPGSVRVLYLAMEQIIREGRRKLVEEHKGRRYKLKTCDGNYIDSMFIDKRGTGDEGEILFIGCEGNAAFYEVGVLGSIIEAGHSVLGWNHPGFGESTGIPFPDQDANAVDVVIQLAINKLGFMPKKIVMFAWSIGGYPATWAAMNYPDLKAVILDATFDDLVPLALHRMPKSWKPLVIRTLKEYMNLNNGQQLLSYPGPVLLIRRTQDEVITTEEPTLLAGNRGNHLLIKLLTYRYPKIVTMETLPLLKDWLSADSNRQATLLSLHEVDEEICESLIASYIHLHSGSFPMLIGEDFSLEQKNSLILFLAGKYMIDLDATHCIPLPVDMVRLPWNPISLSNDQHSDFE